MPRHLRAIPLRGRGPNQPRRNRFLLLSHPLSSRVKPREPWPQTTRLPCGSGPRFPSRHTIGGHMFGLTHNDHRGFSLVELLVASGIVAGLALIFAQSFTNQSKAFRSLAQSGDFNSLVNLISMALGNSTLCPQILQADTSGTLAEPPQNWVTEVSGTHAIVSQPAGIPIARLADGPTVIATTETAPGNSSLVDGLDPRVFR